MADALKVFRGFWIHHKQGLVWTVNDKLNTFVQLVIGFFLGIAQPSVERLVAHTFGWLCYICEKAHSKPVDDEETTVLLNPAQKKKSKWRRCCCGADCCNIHCSRTAAAKVLSWLTIVSGIGYTVAGSFVTSIPADSSVRSASDKCGVYGLRTDALPAAQDEEQIFQGQKETRAAQYARACYPSRSIVNLNQCNIFERQTISTIDMSTGEQCPFTHAEYCDQSGDGYNAVRFSTGKVDSVNIGTNTGKSIQFNRTTICVPLNINQGFVRKSSEQVGHWVYDLGPVSSDEYSSNHTFVQYGDPFTWDVRSYTVSTYEHVYSKNDSDNYWKPIKDLEIRPELSENHTKPYSLTIMFINSCRIFYKDGSSDPIFPADQPWPRNPSLWTNHDSRARPLACVDWKEVCEHGLCGPVHAAVEDRSRDYLFTSFSLSKSSTYEAIQYQGASGLDAQDKIKDDISLALPKTQWINESWALFNTSLARIQYDAFDIANGTGWELRRYEAKLSDEDKMCNFYIFPSPQGFANIQVLPSLGILATILVLWLSGIKTEVEFDEEIKKMKYFDDSRLVGIEWLVWKSGGLCRKKPKASEEAPPELPPESPPPGTSTVPSAPTGLTAAAGQPSNISSPAEQASSGARPTQSSNITQTA